VYFYSDEPGELVHVHVDRGGATAKVWLDPPAIAGSAGFGARDLGEVIRLVRTHRQRLLEAWRDFFDQSRNG
jgi:hypothetical protein